MEPKLCSAFKLAECEPKINLSNDVWCHIISRERRISKIKLISFSIVGLASFLVAILEFKILISDLQTSGFLEYASLIFSDSGNLLSLWKEFALLIAESLPNTSIILSLSLIFIFFLSIIQVAKQIIKERLSPNVISSSTLGIV